MTCLASRWAGLYMLWLFILEGIFERTVRSGFAEIFRCHCHLQCQICFGLGDGQDTEGFPNIGASLGCSHYFYAKVFSQMTSGGYLCHAETSKLSAESLRDWGIFPMLVQVRLRDVKKIP